MNTKFTGEFEPKREVKSPFYIDKSGMPMVSCKCFTDGDVLSRIKKGILYQIEDKSLEWTRGQLHGYGFCHDAQRLAFSLIVIGFNAQLSPDDGKGGPDSTRTKEENRRNMEAQTIMLEEFFEDVRQVQKLLFNELITKHSRD